MVTQEDALNSTRDRVKPHIFYNKEQLIQLIEIVQELVENEMLFSEFELNGQTIL